MTVNNRRRFLQTATVAAVSAASAGALAAANRRTARTPAGKPLVLGLASYSLRQFNLDETLDMTKRVGLKYIAFKSMHLPMDASPAQIKQTVAKVKAAGLTLYGGGVIAMKNAQQVDQAFEYAKAAGMKTIIGSPEESILPMIEKKVIQYDIQVAIHNHGPGDNTWPTPEIAYPKIKNFDRRIGFCHDVGHTKRYGGDPIEQTVKYADRMLDFHMKDVSEASAKGHGCEVGRGVMDIPKLLRAISSIRYKGIVSFEYEKDADNPIAGLAESVGYVRGVLAAI